MSILAALYLVTVDKRSEERRVWLGVQPTKLADMAAPLEAGHFVVSGGLCCFDVSGGVKVRAAAGGGRFEPGPNDAMLIEAFCAATGRESAVSRHIRAVARGTLLEEEGSLRAVESKVAAAMAEPYTLPEVMGGDPTSEDEEMEHSRVVLRRFLAFCAQARAPHGQRLDAMAKQLLVTIQAVSPELLGCLSAKEIALLGGETKAAVSARGRKYVTGTVERRGGNGQFRFQKSPEAVQKYARAAEGNSNRKAKTKAT